MLSVLSFEKEVCAAGLLPAHTHRKPHGCLVVGGGMVDRAWLERNPPARPGEILVNPGDTKHLIEVGDDGLVCVVVEWSEQFNNRKLKRMETERPLQEIARLVDGLSTRNPAGHAIIRSEIVAEIDRAMQCRRYVEPPEWLSESRAAIRTVNANVPISKLARWAGVHRATLAQRFRDTYGMPPEQYKMLYRLEHAARLMTAGNRPARVALEVGFSDQAHLCRTWGRYLGGTPRRWLAAQATIVQDFPDTTSCNTRHEDS